MNFIERIGLAALHRTDPETAHGLALRAVRMGLVPLPGPQTSPRLACSLAGLRLANPVGLAAGFDKNATAFSQLGRAGFGFLELGAATPRPQAGNARPRLFRLTTERAAINRFGFNNDGAKVIAERLKNGGAVVPVGLNLGANKDSSDRAADFASVLRSCGRHVDFVTVNVSSPNTEKLRDLQGAAALSHLLEGVMQARAEQDRFLPVFLKIAPDLDDDGLATLAEVALAQKIDAVIATNTTVSRVGLVSACRNEAGGLSGTPLFERSTRILAQMSHLLGGRIPLIGVGGIASAKEAYEKIRAGASAVQLYTGLVYGGLSLVRDITSGLDDLLRRDGHDNVAQAIGTGREEWL